MLARALRRLPADEGHSHELAVEALLDMRGLVDASAVVDALVHRQDEELLDEANIQLIMSLLEEAGPEAREAAIRLLVRALGAERGIVVDRAAELLVRLAPASTEALVGELRAGPVPADAAYVLGRIGDARTAGAIVEALGHEDATVRAESAAALGELEDPGTVKPLLRAVRDPEHGVRVQAGMALDRIGNAAVVLGVAAMLEPMIDAAVRSGQSNAR